MSFLKQIVALLCLFCAPSYANELLPVPLGHQSTAFVLDDKKAHPAIGARVEFIYKTEKAIPKKVPFVDGFVLGTRENVVFFELGEREAIKLAKYRAKYEVSYQKARDPVPEELKSRREYRDKGLAIRLAPGMRRLTVTMDIDADAVREWQPGQMVTFFGAQEHTLQTKVDGDWKTVTRYHDVTAMFRSAAATEDGQFDVMVVANPREAGHLLRAELEGRLTIDPKAAPNAKESKVGRCFVTHRRGNERTSIEIPCTN